MKRFVAGFALFAATGLLAAQQEPPAKVKAPEKAKPPSTTVPRFNPAATAIVGGSGDTIAIAVSADGKRIANCGGSSNPSSGFVSVIDAASKKELFALRLPQSMDSVGISPNGKLLAYTGQSGELKVVDVDGGKTRFAKKLDGPAKLAFAPDGQSIATATQTKSVQIWDANTGEERTKFLGATVPLHSVDFSADGTKLAAGGGSGSVQAPGIIFIWDVGTKQLLPKLEMGPGLITVVAFSPDGATLASTSNGDQVRIWDVAGAKEKSVLTPFQTITGLAFSPDGKTLASSFGSGRGDIQIWDPATGKEVAELPGHNDVCRCFAFTDGGKKIVSGGSARSLKVWDVAGKKELATLRQDERIDDIPVPLAIAATRDGSLIALAMEDRSVVLRDGRTGAVKTTIKGHEEAITCIAFSPDGKTLVTGSADKTIEFWDAATAQHRATLKGHTGWVFALAFSHDGKTLASGGYDKMVRLWDVRTGKEKSALSAHLGSIRAIAFSPDDALLATGGSDRIVKVWAVAGREFKSMMKGHEGAVRALAFSSDGKALASGGEDGFVKLWNPATGKELVATKKVHNDEVTAIAFAGSRSAISSGTDGQIRQWDIATGEPIVALPGHGGGGGIAMLAGGTSFISTGADRVVKRFRQDAPGPDRLLAGHAGPVHSIDISKDGKRAVTCGNWPDGDMTIRVWDVEKGTPLLKIEHPGQAAMALFSPDGTKIASVSSDSHAYLWDAQTGNQLHRFKGHTDGLNGIAYSADGKRIMTSGADKTVRVWNVDGAEEVAKFTGHTNMVRRVAFHPDGKRALSAGRDSYVRLWELDTGKEIRKFPSNGNWADCLALSRDGKYVSTGGKTMRIWELETGTLIHDCDGHPFGATGADFSPDGKYLVSGGYDGTAKMWDVATGKELYRFRGHREFLFAIAFSPDGQWMLSGGGGANAGDGKWTKGTDHAVRLWRMPDEKTMAAFAPEN